MAAHALGDIASARGDFVAGGALTENAQPRLSSSPSPRPWRRRRVARALVDKELRELGLRRHAKRHGRSGRTRCWLVIAPRGRPRRDASPRIDIRAGPRAPARWRASSRRTFLERDAPTRPRRHTGCARRGRDGPTPCRACGYRLLRIELLVALARDPIWRGPIPRRPSKSAREALDLAAASRLPVRLGRGRRRAGLGRGVLRQPRARTRSPRVHAGARGAQAHRAPGRR